MKVYSLLILAVFGIYINARAQNVVFSAADISNYPTLKIKFSIPQKIESPSISVFEEGKRCNFLLDKKEGRNAVFILIESSAVTHNSYSNNAINRIVSGIAEFSKNEHTNTDFAWGYYNRSNKNNVALNLISTKFQPISNEVVENINKLVNQSQANTKWTDMYKATYESLDWIISNGGAYSSRQLIIIGTGKSLSESPIKFDVCLAKAKEQGVQISTIGLNSGDRYAFDNYKKLLVENNPDLFTNAETSNAIAAALNKYLKFASNTSYSITYKSSFPADGKKHTVQLKIMGKEYTHSFISPATMSFMGKYGYWLAGFIILVLVAFSIKYNSKKKKKSANANGETDTNASVQNIQFNHINSSKTAVTPVTPTRRSQTQITAPPSSLTIINNGKNETIGIIKGLTSFGRSRNNNIVIDNETVSGNHFTIEFTGADCILNNLSQSNGTLVNGIKQSKSAIYAGDKIKVGTVEIFFN